MKALIEFVAVNDITDAKTLAHLLRRLDPSHVAGGRQRAGRRLMVAGKKVEVWRRRTRAHIKRPSTSFRGFPGTTDRGRRAHPPPAGSVLIRPRLGASTLTFQMASTTIVDKATPS
jgi:transposase InsO family protein